jgi:23S rRNA (pseudouridine1915-N3)-methyltransferase
VKVTIVVVGRVKDPIRDVVLEYEARAARYWKLDVHEVDAGARGGSSEPDQVKAAEEQRILARVPENAEVVALTRTGEAIGSLGFARYLEQIALHSVPGVAFVIGGAFGLGHGVMKRARRRISLSALTYPHELARLVLAEQLYRAGTILRGEPYHKGGSL